MGPSQWSRLQVEVNSRVDDDDDDDDDLSINDDDDADADASKICNSPWSV